MYAVICDGQLEVITFGLDFVKKCTFQQKLQLDSPKITIRMIMPD